MGHDLPANDTLDWAIGPPLREVMARLLSLVGDERIELAVTSYRRWYGAVGIYDAQVYPGVPDLLDCLARSGKRLFVATSKRIDFARIVLTHFGLARFFQDIYGPGLDGQLSRKPDLIRHLIQEEGLPAAETILVGDRAQDVEAARANAVGVVGVTWGYGGRDELAGADMVCESPDDLARLLA
jgi:phosphoglycolate phosphatase